MASKSYAETINDAKVMLAGLQTHSERLAKRGLDAAFVTEFNTLYGEAQSLDNEQEQLKATLKAKTDTLQQKLADLYARYAEARKLIKIEMEQPLWREFGVIIKT